MSLVKQPNIPVMTKAKKKKVAEGYKPQNLALQPQSQLDVNVNDWFHDYFPLLIFLVDSW